MLVWYLRMTGADGPATLDHVISNEIVVVDIAGADSLIASGKASYQVECCSP